MPAIRLEQFIIAPTTQTKLVEETPSLEKIETLKREAYEQGVKAGAAAASEAFAAEQTRCLANIQESIDDEIMTREEAHRAALSSFAPLISSLVKTLAPELANSALAAEISASVSQALQSLPDTRLSIQVSENMSADISRMFAHKANLIDVAASGELSDVQAKVQWGGGFDQIDLGETANRATMAIEEFFNELKAEVIEVNNGN